MGLRFIKNYQAFSAGFGRDLFSFGSLSFDATQSHAQLLDKTLTGRSYRLSYSKSFDEARTDITFAGYRFSDETYRSLQQTLDERRTGNESQAQKKAIKLILINILMISHWVETINTIRIGIVKQKNNTAYT